MQYKFNINYAIITRLFNINPLLNIEDTIFQTLCTKMKHNQYGTGHFFMVQNLLSESKQGISDFQSNYLHLLYNVIHATHE
jgi:hypothetical protein